MRTKRLSLAILTVAAALLVIVALVCHIPRGVASAADDVAEFVISTSDGRNWTLSQDSEQISSFEGPFFDYATTNAASARFEARIKQELASQGKSEYSLKFELPAISAEAVGDTTFEYSAQEGGVVIRGIYNNIISLNERKVLQYRRVGGEYAVFTQASANGKEYTFGRLADVGEYDVRFVAYEEFEYDGVWYSVERYSEAIRCEIIPTLPELPDFGVVSVEYGTKAEDIKNAFYDFSGVWTLSAEQDIPNLSADSRLDVKDGEYTVKFDYAPNSDNYRSVAGVQVSVSVYPRTLRIYIDDAHSLAGEPLATNLTYTIATPLAEGDVEADLGARLYIDGIDKDVPGRYEIKARFDNGNYTPYCLNKTDVFINGGLYIVYATRLTGMAADGSEFEAYLESGFDEDIALLRVELVKNAAQISGYEYVAGYRFMFEDSGGNRVSPGGDYVIYIKSLSEKCEKSTHFAVINADGIVGKPTPLGEAEFISAPSDLDVLAFYVECEAVAPNGTSAYLIASYVLIALICVLAVTLVILIVVYKKGRRYFA